MTLKKKFIEILYKQSYDDSECLRIRFENIDKVIDSQEEIADEFAIGFAEWWLDKFTFKDFVHKESKELLEIFKKEKGL
jgi:hypothetical protein